MRGRRDMKIYDESDRCPMCHKQPDEQDGSCDECGDRKETRTCKAITLDKMMPEFIEVVEPVIKWMNENCHPHHFIKITHTTAELLEGQMVHHTEKYLQD